MKKVFPVRYVRKDMEVSGTFYIVANNTQEAEEIAFECIAANPNSRSVGYAKENAKVTVMNSWAHPTETDKVGLIGSGSESLVAKALALYAKVYNELR